MDFDFNKFQMELEKRANKIVATSDIGSCRVISYIRDENFTSNIDFNSFSLSDVIYARDAMNYIEEESDDWDELFVCDPDNPFIIVCTVERILNSLINNDKKTFKNHDEEIFI
ncbi:hypothetical protein [Oceanobacillus massiliensis]|uniref:hypothetical protein n=1 Tax=Oceanobacillus massiliensis TaxID=1465765 RepID=UPI003018EADF